MGREPPSGLPAGFVKAYLGELDRVRTVTVRTAGLIPTPAWSERPADRMMTLRELLAHILDVEDAIVRGVTRGDWRFGRPENSPERLTGPNEFSERSREVRAATTGALTELGEVGLWREVTAPFGYRGPALFLIDSIRENEIHHRGQVYVVMRRLGLEPPWLYGE